MCADVTPIFVTAGQSCGLFDGGQADGVHDAVDKLCELKDRQLDMNVEYLSSGLQHVTLRRVDGAGKAVDVGLSMLTDGLVMSERRREKRLVKLVRGYQAAEQKAKDSHVRIFGLPLLPHRVLPGYFTTPRSPDGQRSVGVRWWR